MSKNKQKQKLTGPWGKLHGAIWIIGLAILAWHGGWWPGILVLVALSMVIEGLLMQYAPEAFEKEIPPSPPAPVDVAPVPSTPAPSASTHRFELLPTICPRCGGPIRGHEVRWTGPQSADCPYCGANLQMGRS